MQFVTVHGSKGLQYPVVYLPMLFNRWVPDETTPLFHDGSRRMLDVGGAPDREVRLQAAAEDAAEELRLTYVALTRAQSQVVCWWAPSWNAETSGLSRLLFGRRPGEAAVPDKVAQGPSDDDIAATLGGGRPLVACTWRRWRPTRPRSPRIRPTTRPPSASARFDRTLDTTWRRTSYSGLIRAEEQIVTGRGRCRAGGAGHRR